MDEPLKKRLRRYSKQCLTEFLDEDFAEAVYEAAEIVKNYKDCRNELCYKCGGYRSIEAFVCDGCRWKDGG